METGYREMRPLKKIHILGFIAFLCAVGFAGCTGTTGAPLSATEVESTREEITMPGRIPIRLFYWACCKPDVTGLNAVVDRFNNSQEAIQLILELLQGDIHTLADEYASGDGPDIVGPLTRPAWSYLPVAWLDLAPWIRSEGYDLSQFPSQLVGADKTGSRMSLPFIVDPSALVYNTELFDAAGLENPPAAYGDTYRMPDGTEVEWTWDAVRDVARLLTLDGGGKNAADPGFDELNIRQYGFTWQFQNHPNYWGSYWAGGSMVAAGGLKGDYKAQVPDAWRAAWRWTYDAIWSDRPFMGSAEVDGSKDFGGGNPFNGGKVAMAVANSWYLCCMQNIHAWDAAALPSYAGQVAGRVEETTFRIWKGTKHPREAFAALAYLTGEGARTLILGGENMPGLYSHVVPARIADQKDWMKAHREEFPWVKHWDVILDGINLPGSAETDAMMPNYRDAWSRGTSFADLLRSTGGLDLDKEIETYLSDLTEIFNR